MPESAPPPAPMRKRPWYLVAALVAASVIGLNATLHGAGEVQYFRSPRPDAGYEVSRGEVIPLAGTRLVLEGAQRRAVVEAMDRVIDAREASRQRLFAIAVAELLLGAVMFFVAGRAMAGRLAARDLLIQLVAARAALAGLAFGASAGVRRAEVAFGRTFAEQTRATAPDDAFRVTEKVLHVFVEVITLLPYAVLAAASALIVLALTRPASRDYFDPSPATPDR